MPAAMMRLATIAVLVVAAAVVLAAHAVRAVMLFVDFPNARAQDNAAPYDDTDAYREFLAPAAGWFRGSSYGRLSLQITPVHKWLHMSQPDGDYGIVRTMPLTPQRRYIREAVELADADVDFSGYDLVYVVPSRNAGNIGLSPAYVDAGDDPIEADGAQVRHGVTFGRDMWNWGFKILVHETGHTFGLPDLYLEPGDTHAAVRGWDLMGNIAGRAPDLLAWHKWKLGWLRDRQVDCVTERGTTEPDRGDDRLRDREPTPDRSRRQRVQHRGAGLRGRLAAALRAGSDTDRRRHPGLRSRPRTAAIWTSRRCRSAARPRWPCPEA